MHGTSTFHSPRSEKRGEGVSGEAGDAESVRLKSDIILHSVKKIIEIYTTQSTKFRMHDPLGSMGNICATNYIEEWKRTNETNTC